MRRIALREQRRHKAVSISLQNLQMGKRLVSPKPLYTHKPRDVNKPKSRFHSLNRGQWKLEEPPTFEGLKLERLVDEHEHSKRSCLFFKKGR